MYVSLESWTSNPDSFVERCARVCYDSVNKTNDKVNVEFIRSLIKRGHLSVLEHATASFQFDEISRALSHQLVRHRLASYSQQSQRYVKMKGFANKERFIVPLDIDAIEDISLDYYDHMKSVEFLYKELLSKGIAPEDARMILPNATFTKIIMTANFREWRHFLDVRGNKHAQWEIRKLAIEVWRILQECSPACFGDYKIVDDCLVRPQYIPSDSIIYYQGEEYSLSQLVHVFKKTKADILGTKMMTKMPKYTFEFGSEGDQHLDNIHNSLDEEEVYPRADMSLKGYENNE